MLVKSLKRTALSSHPQTQDIFKISSLSPCELAALAFSHVLFLPKDEDLPGGSGRGEKKNGFGDSLRN